MNTPLPSGITALLNGCSQEDDLTNQQLYEIIYRELRTLAAYYLRHERGVVSLQPTALVSEAWLRLYSGGQIVWQNRLHFFGVAAHLMRTILIDQARRRKARKRGSPQWHVTLEDIRQVASMTNVELIALDDALKALEKFAPRQHQIVELSFFGGLTNEEIATLMGLSSATIKRDWRAARAWLLLELKAGGQA